MRHRAMRGRAGDIGGFFKVGCRTLFRKSRRQKVFNTGSAARAGRPI
jgi:hypothetical protein